jgi:hypothetical protein
VSSSSRLPGSSVGIEKALACSGVGRFGAVSRGRLNQAPEIDEFYRWREAADALRCRKRFAH